MHDVTGTESGSLSLILSCRAACRNVKKDSWLSYGSAEEAFSRLCRHRTSSLLRSTTGPASWSAVSSCLWITDAHLGQDGATCFCSHKLCGYFGVETRGHVSVHVKRCQEPKHVVLWKQVKLHQSFLASGAAIVFSGSAELQWHVAVESLEGARNLCA